MLVVSESNGVAAHVLQKFEILRLIRVRNRPTLERAVLMHGRTLQEEMFPIERESFSGIEIDGAQAEGLRHLIEKYTLGRSDCDDELVEVRILRPAPEPRMLHVQDVLDLDGLCR